MTMVHSLENAQYVSLGSYRKSGELVETPVWCAHADAAFYVFTAPDSGKVKRLRNGSRATLAVCDVRGKLLGERHPATAVLIDDPEEIERALTLLRRKYGWQMWLFDLGSRLTGRIHKRAYIRAILAEA
jgi:hypothetical protein